MAASELSFEEIHLYFLEKCGKVSNKELVKHFKRYLTHQESKDDARFKFKKYINILATSRTEGDDKYLVLRPKFQDIPNVTSPVLLPQNIVGLPQNTVGLPLDVPFEHKSPVRTPERPKPPPYRPPPPVTSSDPSLDAISISSTHSSSFSISTSENEPPQAPPRKRSVEKTRLSMDDDQSENGDHVISVKERTQKFNRLASVDIDLSPQPQKEKKRHAGADDDDGASIGSVDSAKRTGWIVAAAKGDYHELSKLAGEDPRLAKIRDPFTGYTALHWAAKHGKEDIIKLCAGTYHADPNDRTNGGYTPLHIAMQFNHVAVYKLLIEVYGANKDVRDWSGRKPIQYLTETTKTNKPEGFRNIKSRKKTSDKDLGFLRIGSLNVRVKKTTEAFSNFLGVGNSGSTVDSALDRVSKSWGSADNITKENETAAPKSLPPHKRKMKFQEISQSQSTPASPHQKRYIAPQPIRQDSDSDVACGFGDHWKS